MEIFNFNMSDNKEDIINALIDVYYNNPELFEDEAYCHFDVDDLTGDIYVFNNTREAEYGCACDYILDDDDNIPEYDIRDCVEYFYNEMVDKAEERTSMAKRNGNFIYGESKNRLRIEENNYSETDEFTLVKEMSHWINALKGDFVDDKKVQKAIAQYFYYDEGKHQEDFKEFEATVKQLHKIWLKLDKILEKIENKNIK